MTSSGPHDDALDPQTELARALDGARARFEDADRVADRVGNVRLGLAIAGILLLLMPLVTRSGTPWWGLIPVGLVFFGLARVQDSLLEARRLAAASVRYFELAMSRLDEKWRELSDDGTDVGRPWQGSLHYADDLDLFGPASLFQLLCRARTASGRRTLARWLAEPAEPEEARPRQHAVQALADDLDLRRAAFAAVADDADEPLDDERLLGWARGANSIPDPGLWRVVGLVMPVLLGLTAAWAFLIPGGPREPFYLVGLVQVCLLVYTRSFTAEPAARLSGPERILGRYARLIAVVEQMPESHRVGPLGDAHARLRASGRAASEDLRGLERLVEMLDARLNMFFAVTVGPALMWELNVVLRAEAWRARAGKQLEGWLEALGLFEAVASLGAFAHERPDYAFPELLRDGETFEAEGLTHPLLDRRMAVSNDLQLGGKGSVLLLSGSNMSGKSTLLRSVGLAVVMARMGAPVAATRLRVSSLALASSVRVVDSLAAGASHFYAELRRLKHVTELASAGKGRALVYLLDEVLHGTNSRERFIGAVSVMKWLSERGAVGIVTTHDLELGRLADVLPGGTVTHAHFSDDVTGNGLSFDYTLRTGPIGTTNALRMMKAVGIDVEMVDL